MGCLEEASWDGSTRPLVSFFLCTQSCTVRYFGHSSIVGSTVCWLVWLCRFAGQRENCSCWNLFLKSIQISEDFCRERFGFFQFSEPPLLRKLAKARERTFEEQRRLLEVACLSWLCTPAVGIQQPLPHHPTGWGRFTILISDLKTFLAVGFSFCRKKKSLL